MHGRLVLSSYSIPVKIFFHPQVDCMIFAMHHSYLGSRAIETVIRARNMEELGAHMEGLLYGLMESSEFYFKSAMISLLCSD